MNETDNGILPLQEFEFARCNSNHTFTSSYNLDLLGALVSNGASVLCGPNGISPFAEDPFFISEKNITLLKQHFQHNNSSGMTISLWFQPHDTSLSTFQPILTIGGRGNNVTKEHDFFTCNNYFLSFGHFQRKLYLQYQAYDRCRLVRFTNVDLKDNQLVNTVLSFHENATTLYTDGNLAEAAPSAPIDITFNQMNEDYVLRLFSKADSLDYFKGSVAQLSVFPLAFDKDQVLEIYEKGYAQEQRSNVTLVAVPAQKFDIAQDDVGKHRLRLCTETNSSAEMPLWASFEQLTSYGKLLTESYSLIKKGDRVPLQDGSACIDIFYSHDSPDSFSEPSINARGVNLKLLRELFVYQFYGISTDNEIIGISDPVIQQIGIVHVNSRPVVSIERLNVTETNITERAIFGIEVDDTKDQDLDRVRVDIKASNGTLSLPSNTAGLADFVTCRGRTESSWQCLGDGKEDRAMTFVALPTDIDTILDGLRYSRVIDGADDIVVRILDGSGSDCLSEDEHIRWAKQFQESSTSIRRDCTVTEARIHIPYDNTSSVSEKPGSENSIFGIPNTDFRNFGLADLIFWIFVFSVLGCLCMCGRLCCYHCLARGATIHIDDDLIVDESSDTDSEESVDIEQPSMVQECAGCVHCARRKQDNMSDDQSN